MTVRAGYIYGVCAKKDESQNPALSSSLPQLIGPSLWLALFHLTPPGGYHFVLFFFCLSASDAILSKLYSFFCHEEKTAAVVIAQLTFEKTKSIKVTTEKRGKIEYNFLL